MITDNLGNVTQNEIFPRTVSPLLGNYISSNRYQTSLVSHTASGQDNGINLLWLSSSNELLINSECDRTPGPFEGNGGSFYSQVNPTTPHSDSYLTETDALFAVDPTGAFVPGTYRNVAPFDGIDFVPRLDFTPSDNGFVVAGNLSYTSPDFPSPASSVGGSPTYNHNLNTLMGVNVDIVKLDAGLNRLWEHQYLQSQGTNPGTPPNAAVTCEWGLATTADGFAVCGNNELNDEDYSVIKLQYPTCGGTAVSLLPSSSTPNSLLYTPISTNTTWNTPRLIEGVVDIQPGAILDITSGANIQFANQQETGINSKIVVERGGSLIIENGAIIEGISSCVTPLWNGIEVWGTSNTNQTSPNVGTVIVQSGGTVKNMNNNGIYTTKNNPEDIADWTFNGGVIRGNNGNFLDNERSIQMLPYANIHNHNINLSFFKNCTFTVDQFTPPGFRFFTHVSLYDVHTISFVGDRFFNTVPYPAMNVSQNRGSAILSTDATFLLAPNGAQGSLVQGFNVGIKANSPVGWPMYVVANSTTQNSFNNNLYDIYSGTTLFSEFTYTNYTKMSFNHLVVPGTYNVFLDGTTGYLMQANNFAVQNIAGAPTGVYGTIANNSGTRACLIENNSYDGSSAGNMAVGTEAQGTISPAYANLGLTIHCNSYTNPMPSADWAILPNSNGSIGSVQGICTSRPSTTANNTWSQTCSGAHDIVNNGNSFSYTWGGPAATYKPNFSCGVTGTVSIGASACGPTVDCTIPSGGNNPSALRNTQNHYQHVVDSLDSILNGGNAPSLYSIINTGNPGQIQSALIAPGPYLSDGVLIAAINKNLPPGILDSIILFNSPVDSAVMAALNTISLPKGIRNQINNAQFGASARTELQEEITYESLLFGNANNALVSFYLNDTIQGAVDSAISALQITPGSCDQLMPLASLQIANGQYMNAVVTLNNLQNNCGATYNNFCNLMRVIIRLQGQPTRYFALLGDPMDSAIIGRIAMDTIHPGYVQARGIMTLVFNKQYKPYVAPFVDHSERLMGSNTTSNNSSVADINSQFKLYPNPANSELNISYNLPNGSSDATLTLFDMLGNKISDYTLPSNSSIITKNISNLATGFYVYTINSGQQIMQRGKIVIVR